MFVIFNSSTAGEFMQLVVSLQSWECLMCPSVTLKLFTVLFGYQIDTVL